MEGDRVMEAEPRGPFAAHARVAAALGAFARSGRWAPSGGRFTRVSGRRVGRMLALTGVAGVLVASTFAAAGPIAAADNLLLTTPYPSVSVAPGSKASFDLTVVTANPTRVDLALSGVPTGWTATLNGGGYVVSAVLAQASAPPTVRLDVKVPADAQNQTYHMQVTATSGTLRSDLAIDVNVSATAAGDVTLTTDFPSLNGPSSQTFSFNLTLKNDTAQDLTFGLNAQGPTGWTVTAKPTSQTQASTFQVNAGESAGVTVSADPPTDIAAGSYPITVSATAGDRNVGGQLQVEITGQYGMTLTTPDGRLNATGSAGSVISRPMTIQNTGTAPLTNVTVTDTVPSGWKVTYDPAGPIASIAPNGTANVTALITPSSNAIAGDYATTFTANAPDSSTTSSADIRITVETPLNWLLVGAGLIVLVLLGLGWVFQRYGRR
jgi:uncharacterized repeat protein (TIGR01451 family)